VSVGVSYTAVDAAAGGLTTEWWAVVLECVSSHPLIVDAQVAAAEVERVNPSGSPKLNRLQKIQSPQYAFGPEKKRKGISDSVCKTSTESG